MYVGRVGAWRGRPKIVYLANDVPTHFRCRRSLGRHAQEETIVKATNRTFASAWLVRAFRFLSLRFVCFFVANPVQLAIEAKTLHEFAAGKISVLVLQSFR